MIQYIGGGDYSENLAFKFRLRAERSHLGHSVCGTKIFLQITADCPTGSLHLQVVQLRQWDRLALRLRVLHD